MISSVAQCHHTKGVVMADIRKFTSRIPSELYVFLEKMAKDESQSINGMIIKLLKDEKNNRESAKK